VPTSGWWRSVSLITLLVPWCISSVVAIVSVAVAARIFGGGLRRPFGLAVLVAIEAVAGLRWALLDV
jgi:hypothetical protein